MSVFICVQMWYMYVQHVYGGLIKSQLSSSGTSSILFETDTLIGLKLISEVRLATSKPLESSFFYPPVLGLQDCDIRLGIITCILEIEHRSLSLHGKCSIG